MRPYLLVVGDPVADHLVPALREHAEGSGWAVRVVDPHGLAELPLAVDGHDLHVDGQRVDAVLFRLSLELLVAPGFDDDDRTFTTNELRAVWTHALTLPTVATPNHGVAVSSLLRDPHVWRERLAAAGLPVAPLHIGRAPVGTCWLRADGTLAPVPDARFARTLGVPTVAARAWRPVVCCGGEVEPGLPASITAVARRAARVLADAGAGLAQLCLDHLGRVLSVGMHPVVTVEHADWAAAALLRSLDRRAEADRGRRSCSATHEEDLACCS